MGRSYSAHLRNGRKSLIGNSEGRRTIQLRWSILLKWILCRDVNLFHLAQDKECWRALGNTVLKLRVPKRT